MKCHIEVFGYARCITVGSVTQEIFDYIQNEFDGDADEYVQAWMNDDVPEDYCASESVYCCNDIYSRKGCQLFMCHIIIKDDNGATIFEVNGAENLKCQYRDEQIPMPCKYAIKMIDDGKGKLLEGTFNIRSPFDTSKLVLKCVRVDGVVFIESVKYRNREVTEYVSDYTDWKGIDSEIIVAL